MHSFQMLMILRHYNKSINNHIEKINASETIRLRSKLKIFLTLSLTKVGLDIDKLKYNRDTKINIMLYGKIYFCSSMIYKLFNY